MSAAGSWSVRRILAVLLGAASLAYGGAAAWLVTQETELVFRAGRPLAASRPAFPYEQIDVRRADGAWQIAWVMHADAAPEARGWVLYLHGNAATIASRGNIAHYEALRALGLNVFAPEYRGFGGLAGTPTEASVVGDARAAYDHLRTALGVSPDRLVIFGWSLGGAIGVDLASQVPHAALILEGAPASVAGIGELQYPYFPVRLLIRNPFEAVGRIGRVAAPILFLHSPEDRVIPIAEGRRLYDAAPEPKTFVEVRGGHVHASEVDAPVFYGAIRRFLAARGLVPPARE